MLNGSSCLLTPARADVKLSTVALSRCSSIESKNTTFTKSDLKVAFGFPPLATCVAESSESGWYEVRYSKVTIVFYAILIHFIVDNEMMSLHWIFWL